MLLPGHGSVVLEEASLDVKKCRERLDRDLAAGREITVSRFTPDYRQTMFGHPGTPFTLVAPNSQSEQQ
jgi:hypothetical protein